MLEYLFAKNLCNSLCLQETWWNNQTCQKNATAVCPVCLGYLVHPGIGCFRFPKVSHFSDFHFAFGSTFDGSCIFLVRCKDLFWSLATNWAQLPPVAGCAQPTSRGWLKMWTSSEQFRTATQAFDNDIVIVIHCQSTKPQKRNEEEMHCLKRWDVLPWLRTVMSLFVAIERTLCSVMREMRWHSWKSHGSDERCSFQAWVSMEKESCGPDLRSS